jgi:Rps23 Pro-64 3,4-dihydroxylase Tpa1-like proline 4-hydroxylase
MTAKQILDAFSETLMQDERILTPREGELLMSLLQNSRAVSSGNPEIQSAVTTAIARSVGETVAQRAFALLGGSIVEQILANSGISAGTEKTVQLKAPGPDDVKAPRPQRPPQPPHVVPRPDRAPGPDPAPGPDAPGPDSPPGPGLRPLKRPVREQAQQSQIDSGSGVVVLDAPATGRAQCVVLDEFLAPRELDELVAYTLQNEAEFRCSEIISPNGDRGVINYDHRRSRVLMDLGRHEEIILERIRCVLPRVLDQLGVEEFPVTHVETQITASNDGDFFRAHSDNSQESIAARRVTFVYFFHREPRQFEGGELRLHDSPGDERPVGPGSYQTGSYQSIVPQQNQIVFFPCSVLHEITPVECSSRAFADSRFTLNGWLHK